MDQFIAQLSDKQKALDIVKAVENKQLNGVYYSQDVTDFFEAMKKIMKEKHPPKECLYGLKIVKDCIEKFNTDFRNKVKSELLELIYEVATFRIKDTDDSRGTTYFKNPEHEKQIEQYGASYIRLALDCIRVWALWFPDFKGYGQRLEKEQGYLPKINYFKQELINEHINKNQVSSTPHDDTGSIQNKIRQLNQQLINYLQSHTEVNSFLKDELEKINVQIEDLVVQEVQDQFLDEFVLTYPEFQSGKISYQEFRMQFLSSSQLKKGSQNILDESNMSQSINQASKVQKPLQQQQQYQSSYDQSYVLKNEQQNEIESLRNQLQAAQQECQRYSQTIQQNDKRTQELQQELQNCRVQIENLKNQRKEEQQSHDNTILKEYQQQIDHYKNLYELQLKQQNYEQQQPQYQQQAQQQSQIISQQQYDQQNQQIQNYQEEIENLRVSYNIVNEKLKIHEQKGNATFSEYDFMNLKKKYDELDSKYFILKQENHRLKQTNQEYGNQQANQSRISESFAREIDQKDENSNVVFFNFKENDLWQGTQNANQSQSLVNSRMRDVSELIYPHKTAAEYYRQNGKKQFKGTLINRSALQLQLNPANLLNYKKASLNQLATLFQSNKIEIKSRQQLTYGLNKQEFISTTISIKNKELKSIQLQIFNTNKNIWCNKETKSTLLQSQQTILYEFIREANVKLHELSLIKVSVSFENFILYLPSFLRNCIQYYHIEASTYKTMKKQFQGSIYATPLLPISCKTELKQLSEQGQLLNQWEQENEDLITESKYAFKAVLSNQLEFYLELIMTPCDEFLFRGFTSFDEETLQFVLNGLSNLYS
ncbi:unnamed protein product (macronuclear) [Paramecium tetraurelia]|uniref:VHS domain-containing protein n=1 Tax=Paramecium tetraurelia TaxID=5888 RepID=A0C820_PARTE|nr:uncharacterized protein GSPATT00036068001 [Paramecium tetraurelia]CAK66937.1 unnamed protein product [Paramecium tetraurelia]|eukprot:XP_001434334.1 hypothetical protein (macronuclear) [Paramecium tetraurelia strain d4-2]